MLHETMQAQRACEEAEAVERDAMAMQIVDSPAAPRMPLHPAEEADDRVLRQMMGEQR
jgi:hypothetical protein